MRKPDLDPRLIHELAVRALSHADGLVIERTSSGGSTQVYRIRRGSETFYLRVAETTEVGHLGQEALVHRLLRERGARVPEVIHYDPFDEALGRSFMVTTEIPGHPLSDANAMTHAPAVLVAAGRDLAIVNSLAVAGFGWVTSDPSPSRLTAEQPSHRAFVFEHFEEDLSRLIDGFLRPEETATIRAIIARHDARLDVEHAHLAHGDFDVSHVYHHHGRYTGIIDFGEIRSADRLYDLGHYDAHDGQTLSALTLNHLLQGYRDVVQLTGEDEIHVHLWALLIALRRLAIAADRPALKYPRHLVAAIRRAIATLRL
ncbi:MAG: phosphotransferase [Thermomicrobiales bacterium]